MYWRSSFLTSSLPRIFHSWVRRDHGIWRHIIFTSATQWLPITFLALPSSFSLSLPTRSVGSSYPSVWDWAFTSDTGAVNNPIWLTRRRCGWQQSCRKRRIITCQKYIWTNTSVQRLKRAYQNDRMTGISYLHQPVITSQRNRRTWKWVFFPEWICSTWFSFVFQTNHRAEKTEISALELEDCQGKYLKLTSRSSSENLSLTNSMVFGGSCNIGSPSNVEFFVRRRRIGFRIACARDPIIFLIRIGRRV